MPVFGVFVNWNIHLSVQGLIFCLNLLLCELLLLCDAAFIFRMCFLLSKHFHEAYYVVDLVTLIFTLTLLSKKCQTRVRCFKNSSLYIFQLFSRHFFPCKTALTFLVCKQNLLPCVSDIFQKLSSIVEQQEWLVTYGAHKVNFPYWRPFF